jgi:hypothetical protein
MLAIVYSVGFMIMLSIYAPFIYKDLNSIKRTEVRQYEVVNYSFKGKSSKKVIVVRDVLSGYNTYVYACDVSYYNPKDILLINTEVIMMNNRIDRLNIIDNGCR